MRNTRCESSAISLVHTVQLNHYLQQFEKGKLNKRNIVPYIVFMNSTGTNNYFDHYNMCFLFGLALAVSNYAATTKKKIAS